MQALQIFLLLFLSVSAPASAAWREATSEHFIIYSDGNEQQLVNFTRRLEQLHEILTINLSRDEQQDPGPKLRILLLASDSQVRDYMAKPDKNVIGFYSASLSGAYAIASRAGGGSMFDIQGQTILFHEYVHHFMFQHFNYAYPAWFVEGFAEYFSVTQFKYDNKVEVGGWAVHRLSSLMQDKWLPMSRLMTSNLAQLQNASEREQLYAQGWLLVHYLMKNKQRQPQLVQYLRLLNEGKSHDVALSESFGMTDEMLGKELKRYFAGGKIPVSIFTLTDRAAQSVAVRLLPEGEAAMQLLVFRGHRSLEDEPKKTAFLAEVRRIAATYGADPRVRATAAALELQHGDWKLAFAELEKLVVEDAANRDAWEMLALARLRQTHYLSGLQRPAMFKAARQAAIKANRLDPQQPLPLYLFYCSFEEEEKGPSANALLGLKQARNLFPQNPRIAEAAAIAYWKEGDLKSAEALMKPFANDPHRTADIGAKTMLDRLVAREPAPDYASCDSISNPD